MSPRESPMDIEFDTVARWTGDVVERLGPDFAIPAACRGSASPSGLDWLSDRCGLAPGQRLADVGGGTGGPAAYARQQTGVRPVVVDPMPGACATAAALFGLDTVVGLGERLPLADGAVDACWCIGVVCTTPDKAGLLAELRRILVPGGSAGLLVFAADRERLDDAPEGNRFPTPLRLGALLADAGFRLADEIASDELPATPPRWRQRIERVDAEMTRLHGDDPRFAEAGEQSHRLGALMESGHVRGHLVHVVAR